MSSNAQTPYPVWGRFEFTGTAGEYFRIWIVNIALTVVTLGIYSAWAKVRRLTYFYGNTHVHGSSFRYTARPIAILKGRVIAVIVFAVFYAVFNFYPAASLWALVALCVLFPVVVVLSTGFRLHNTMYRSMRFRFERDFLGAYRVFLVPLGIVILVTAVLYGMWEGSDMLAQIEQQVAESEEEVDFRREDMLFSIFFLALLPAIPYVQYALRRFMIDRVHYGSADGAFHAGAWAFYKVFLKLFALTLALIFGVGLLAGALMSGIGAEAAGEELTPEQMASVFALMIPLMILFYGIGFYLVGYMNARLANLTFNHAELGPLAFSATLRARDLGTIYLTNTLAIIVSLGLLVPWAQIRLAAYRARRVEALARDLDAIDAIAAGDPAAYGEELGEVFDIDIGF